MKRVPARVKALDKAMPFKADGTPKTSRSFKVKQRAWTLAGLRHMRAPLVGIAKRTSKNEIETANRGPITKSRFKSSSPIFP